MSRLRRLLVYCVSTGVIVASLFLAYGPMMDRTLWGRHLTVEHLEELRKQAARDPKDPRSLRKLVAALESGSSFQGAHAAIQLGKLGPKAAPAVQALVAAVQGEDRYVAPEAARALGEIGSAAETAVPVLIRMTCERADRDTGWYAAEAIGKIAKPDDTAALSALRHAATNSDFRMAYSARDGIAAMRARAAAATRTSVTTIPSPNDEKTLERGTGR